MNSLNYNSSPINSSALPRVELEILRGRTKNKIRRIDVPVFLIGSAPDCDLVLADDEFPEVHTYLYVTKTGVSVRRLGEGPQLCINGQEVQNAVVQSGERVQLGKYEFTLHVQPEEPLRKPHTAEIATTPVVATNHISVQPGVAEVMALLAEIRATLQVESGLKLYCEPEDSRNFSNMNTASTSRKASA
jgi:pSer/pThr/pTyr-binding forkhead associated (FHA) protein